MIKLSASVLGADIGNLEREILSVDPFVDEYHVDVMDGYFVPNIVGSPDLVKFLKGVSEKPVDVHLMVSKPEKFVDIFVDAGADMITFHFEAGSSNYVYNLALEICKAGPRIGLAYNPGTAVFPSFPVDRILIMSVHPGFSGQKFIYDTVDKVRCLRSLIGEYSSGYELAVDGGINSNTFFYPVIAGADVLVSGSCIFDSDSRKEFLKGLEIVRKFY